MATGLKATGEQLSQMSNSTKDSSEPVKKESLAFRAPQPLAEQVRRFADENSMSQSDALRQLVRDGLEVEEIRDDMETLEQRVERLEEETEECGWLASLLKP
jgi:ubiquinone biosynthesis protein UbiJ